MAGIYIHVPFCKQKCTYCDFHFSTTFDSYREKMIEAIIAEINLQKNYLKEQIQTIYFGGGTPSILNEKELLSIIKTINLSFQINPQVEITLEANPDDMCVENLNMWQKIGINRLSVGLQSFQQNELDWMNRAHDVQQALKCIINAQKLGFANISIDLIYGLPFLNLDIWQQTLTQAINLNVQHISAYCLTVEPKTALQNWVKKKTIVLGNEDSQSEQFELLVKILEKSGFEQYEISNFAKPGFRSKHNANYWKGVPYLGIGPSAHSFNGSSRQWNIANNQLYIQKIKNNLHFYEVEKLTPDMHFNELILTGLRTKEGVNLNQLEKINDISVEFSNKLKDFKLNNWLEIIDNQIVLTPEGKLMADHICSELFI